MSYPAVIFGALIMGALLGLIPGIVGYKKDKRGLAVSGFITCVVGSFILGLYCQAWGIVRSAADRSPQGRRSVRAAALGRQNCRIQIVVRHAVAKFPPT